MFYFVFFVFSVGAALLQSAHLRAPKGVVPTRRRRTYTAVAALATLLQVLTGWLSIDPGIIGALLFIPIFYVVNKVIERTSLRLRYTFRIGLAFTILSAYPMIHPLITDAMSTSASKPVVKEVDMRRIIRLILALAVVAIAVPQLHAQVTPRAQHIYNEDADAKKDIQGALALAQATNKNVLLDFGANWCPDCQVLDIYMHDDVNSPLIDKYYIVVHVDVGRMDKNLDVAFTFNVPINKGIPALAVVQPSGRVVYSQTHGEFENMRAMKSSSLTEFLKMWKPHGPRK